MNNKSLLKIGGSESPESPAPAVPTATVAPAGRPTLYKWSLIKADYIAGNGSLRFLAQQHSLSPSTVMKKAAREKWEAARSLTGSTTVAMVAATLQQRASDFVNRVADQTDKFVSKVAASEQSLEPQDRQGLRQLAAAMKDVVSVGRLNYKLDDGSDNRSQCIVNLEFLRDYDDHPVCKAVEVSAPLLPVAGD